MKPITLIIIAATALLSSGVTYFIQKSSHRAEIEHIGRQAILDWRIKSLRESVEEDILMYERTLADIPDDVRSKKFLPELRMHLDHLKSATTEDDLQACYKEQSAFTARRFQRD